MRHFATEYMIEPRPELAEWLTGRVDDVLVDVLTESVVLMNTEGGRSAWTPADHALTVKLMYLASLRQYSPLDTDAGFESVLGSALISQGLFDRWWTLRPLPASDNAEYLQKFLIKYSDRIERTGNDVVDSWLEKIRDHAEQSAAPDGRE